MADRQGMARKRKAGAEEEGDLENQSGDDKKVKKVTHRYWKCFFSRFCIFS